MSMTRNFKNALGASLEYGTGFLAYFPFDYLARNAPEAMSKVVETLEENWVGAANFIGAQMATTMRFIPLVVRNLYADEPFFSLKNAKDFGLLAGGALLLDAVAAEATKAAVQAYMQYNDVDPASVDQKAMENVSFFGTQAVRLGLLGVAKGAQATYNSGVLSRCSSALFGSKPKADAMNQDLLSDHDLENQTTPKAKR